MLTSLAALLFFFFSTCLLYTRTVILWHHGLSVCYTLENLFIPHLYTVNLAAAVFLEI